MSRADAVQLTAAPLPEDDEVEDAVKRSDLATLLALDRQIRDTLPIGRPVPMAVAVKGAQQLQNIARALGVIALSDSGPTGSRRSGGARDFGAGAETRSPAERTDEMRAALKLAREGQVDVPGLARAAAIKARLKG
jgi:hypothetical protein